MHIYFSGIGGVGIGPLAKIAAQAGHEVSGSDAASSSMTHQLERQGITVFIGQSGAEIARQHALKPIDWLVVSAAIPQAHPEMIFAKKHAIRVSKRDELLNEIIAQAKQKLVAVSGTHGKTTVTGMLIWLFKQFGLPISYSVGTQISFGSSGQFDSQANFFVYEADEFDRNMLHFRPYLALITTVDYDHPDVYPTPADYDEAFRQFAHQSQSLVMWQADVERLNIRHDHLKLIDEHDTEVSNIRLAGQHNRENAWQAATAFRQLFPDRPMPEIIKLVNTFPGTERRFERLASNVYTDYAHHPKEIQATLQLARELNDRVIAVYQPHQNIRQHELQDQYGDCFMGAERVYWLPTYLSREDPALATLSPQQLIQKLDNPAIAEPAVMDDALVQQLRAYQTDGALVLIMGAGDVDAWARKTFSK